MIEASFDRSSRAAAVSGVYQYDTGQRLRMRGLPSPDELLAGDDLLAGDLVAVQVHYGYSGDEQTDMRLAQWRDRDGCWVVDIPDEYLTRIDPVNVYVYMDYGENEYGNRARTMYEGVFSPISRPAPNNVASEEMMSKWAELEVEVNQVLEDIVVATENAEGATKSALAAAEATKEPTGKANEAAETAEDAADRLDSLHTAWNGMAVQVNTLDAGAEATVTKSGSTWIVGVPKGADGAKGATGATGPADITLSFAASTGVLTITPK